MHKAGSRWDVGENIECVVAIPWPATDFCARSSRDEPATKEDWNAKENINSSTQIPLTAQKVFQWQPNRGPPHLNALRITLFRLESISILCAYHKTRQESTWSKVEGSLHQKWRYRTVGLPPGIAWYRSPSSFKKKNNQLTSFSLQRNDLYWCLVTVIVPHRSPCSQFMAYRSWITTPSH